MLSSSALVLKCTQIEYGGESIRVQLLAEIFLSNGKQAPEVHSGVLFLLENKTSLLAYVYVKPTLKLLMIYISTWLAYQIIPSSSIGHVQQPSINELPRIGPGPCFPANREDNSTIH